MKTVLESNKMECSSVLGIPVSVRNTEETLSGIFDLAAIPSGEKWNGPAIVVTVNVDFMVNTHRFFSSKPMNKELLSVMRASPLVSADGMPVVLLGRLTGMPLPERVAGADLVPMIAERAARTGKKLYFLGGEEKNTLEAARILRNRFPGLNICGIDTPFVTLKKTPEDLENNRRICEKINASAPDILLTAFGNPKQELWVSRNLKNLKVPVSIGIGGSFNFLCGAVKRAPKWMRKSGMEWIYRIIQEPGRLIKRYAIGLAVYGILSLESVSAHLYGKFFSGESELSLPEETSDSVVLDCSKLRNVSPEMRICVLKAHVQADRLGKKLLYRNLSLGAKLQLKAHRLFD